MSCRRQTPVVVPPSSPTPRLTNLDPVDEEVFDPVVTPENLTLTLEDPIVEAQSHYPMTHYPQARTLELHLPHLPSKMKLPQILP